ncbi:MAG: hypothetical protein AAFX85_16165, partial [Pseudomonadota bacterium]
MLPIRKHHYSLTIFAISLVMAGFPLEGQAARWYRAVSENFIVYSDLPEREMRQLAVDFEYFRLVLEKLLDAPDIENAPPVEVFAFQQGADYAEVGSPGTAGVYSSNVGRPNAMLFHPIGRRTNNFGRQVLFHEYVHHFVGR